MLVTSKGIMRVQKHGTDEIFEIDATELKWVSPSDDSTHGSVRSWVARHEHPKLGSLFWIAGQYSGGRIELIEEWNQHPLLNKPMIVGTVLFFSTETQKNIIKELSRWLVAHYIGTHHLVNAIASQMSAISDSETPILRKDELKLMETLSPHQIVEDFFPGIYSSDIIQMFDATMRDRSSLWRLKPKPDSEYIFRGNPPTLPQVNSEAEAQEEVKKRIAELKQAIKSINEKIKRGHNKPPELLENELNITSKEWELLENKVKELEEQTDKDKPEIDRIKKTHPILSYLGNRIADATIAEIIGTLIAAVFLLLGLPLL